MKKIIALTITSFLVLQSFTVLKHSNKSDSNKSVLEKSTIKADDKGKVVYNKICVACHQAEGQGIPNAFPPLAKSDYLNKDVKLAIKAVANGLSGEITVNGKKYNNAMPKPNLTDQEIADVLNYVYSSWGNSKKVVTPAMVKANK